MGSGCFKCDNKNKTTEEFIFGAKEIHGDRYDYSLTNYTRCKSKIKIICPIHGKFEQTPSDHLSGYGCKLCYESKGELRIKKYLDENKIKYVREKTFNNCKNKLPLHFDFYLPQKSLLIEYDGQQHFKPIKFFGGENNFKIGQNNDKIKNNFAKDNNIDLLRIKYDQINNIEQILKNIL
jgi:very-short-patch-repair endonuclease